MNPILEKVIKDHYGQQTAESYDKMAYDFFWGYRDSLKTAAFFIFYTMFGEIQKSNKLNLLDLGSGTGNLSIEILNQFRSFARLRETIGQDWLSCLNLTLQDQSNEMLKIAQQKIESKFSYQVNLACNDMISFFEAPQKYDVIFSSFAVHHLNAQEKRTLFTKIAAHLNPRGLFVLVDRMKGQNDAEDKKFLANVAAPFFSSVSSEVSFETLTKTIQQQFDDDFDDPSTLAEQMLWLEESKLKEIDLIYRSGPIAVITARS